MRYPVTATSSVDAVHMRLICEEETAVAERLVGTDGAVVSAAEQDCESAGLLAKVPQAFVSVHVRVCVPPEQILHAVQVQLSVQDGGAAPMYSSAPISHAPDLAWPSISVENGTNALPNKSVPVFRASFSTDD